MSALKMKRGTMYFATNNALLWPIHLYKVGERYEKIQLSSARRRIINRYTQIKSVLGLSKGGLFMKGKLIPRAKENSVRAVSVKLPKAYKQTHSTTIEVFFLQR